MNDNGDFAIQADALMKQYPGVCALNGLSLRVPKGTVYGFLGRNGAGKSTTIKTLLGLVRPDFGNARVFGDECGPDRTDILERIAYVGERKALYGSLTPREIIRFNRGFYPRWSDAAAEKYARLFDVPLDRRFGKLSHGNQTKVCLLLALAQQADLLMLDEPTSGLDPVYLDEVLRVIVEDHVNEGRTVFFSSHDLAEVEQVAEWVGIIDHGRMLLEARLDDIRNEYRLVTAAGANLPDARDLVEGAFLATRQNDFARYLVARDAEGFASELHRQGAAVTEVASVNLRELFLALVRKEEPCISGNRGMTLASHC